jgi:hypothetical protein
MASSPPTNSQDFLKDITSCLVMGGADCVIHYQTGGVINLSAVRFEIGVILNSVIVALKVFMRRRPGQRKKEKVPWI